MPEIRTDDAPRRLRQVWLGPRGFRLWFEWTYPRLFMFVFCWSLTGPTAWFTLAQAGLRGHVAFTLGVFGYGFGLAWLVAWLANKGVTADEPLLYRLSMFVGIVRPRPIVSTEPVGMDVHMPPIAEMSPGLRRAITGRNTTTTTTTIKEDPIHDHIPAVPFEPEDVDITIAREDLTRPQPRPQRAAGFAEAEKDWTPQRAAV